MAILTNEQRATLATLKAALAVVLTAHNRATALIQSVETADANPLLNGNVTAENVWADAVASWGPLCQALEDAAKAVPG